MKSWGGEGEAEGLGQRPGAKKSGLLQLGSRKLRKQTLRWSLKYRTIKLRKTVEIDPCGREVKKAGVGRRRS